MWFFMTTVTVTVFAVGAIGIVTDYLKDRKRLAMKAAAISHGAEADGATLARLKQIEERMANLESVVLEYERNETFNRSLSMSR